MCCGSTPNTHTLKRWGRVGLGHAEESEQESAIPIDALEEQRELPYDATKFFQRKVVASADPEPLRRATVGLLSSALDTGKWDIFWEIFCFRANIQRLCDLYLRP